MRRRGNGHRLRSADQPLADTLAGDQKGDGRVGVLARRGRQRQQHELAVLERAGEHHVAGVDGQCVEIGQRKLSPAGEARCTQPEAADLVVEHHLAKVHDAAARVEDEVRLIDLVLRIDGGGISHAGTVGEADVRRLQGRAGAGEHGQVLHHVKLILRRWRRGGVRRQVLAGGTPGVADLIGAVVQGDPHQLAERIGGAAVQRRQGCRRRAAGLPGEGLSLRNDALLEHVLGVGRQRDQVLGDRKRAQIERRALVGNGVSQSSARTRQPALAP